LLSRTTASTRIRKLVAGLTAFKAVLLEGLEVVFTFACPEEAEGREHATHSKFQRVLGNLRERSVDGAGARDNLAQYLPLNPFAVRGVCVGVGSAFEGDCLLWANSRHPKPSSVAL
jgi:hypothetical protein